VVEAADQKLKMKLLKQHLQPLEHQTQAVAEVQVWHKVVQVL
jgi:hypothetical protein